MQTISLDSSGCDLVAELIDIGTNLLYDVLGPWSGSQPKPINPICECRVAFFEKIRTLNWLRWFLSTPVGDALQITYARVTINIAKSLNVPRKKNTSTQRENKMAVIKQQSTFDFTIPTHFKNNLGHFTITDVSIATGLIVYNYFISHFLKEHLFSFCWLRITWTK